MTAPSRAMSQYDSETDSLIMPPPSDASALGQLLGYLSRHMPTLWHIAAQHSLRVASEFIALHTGFREARRIETAEDYAVALTRFMVIHGMKEQDNEVVATRMLHAVH